MLFSTIISALLQVALFTIIPWIFWFVTARKREGFFRWIGLHGIRSRNGKKLILLMLLFSVGLIAFGRYVVWVIGDVGAVQSSYRGQSICGVFCALIYAYVQTGLSEELFFRGFLMKRLEARIGFRAACLIQGGIFGVIHLLETWGHVTVYGSILSLVYPLAAGMIFAYLNEKQAGGSILPSWLMHGTFNAIARISQIFL